MNPSDQEPASSQEAVLEELRQLRDQVKTLKITGIVACALLLSILLLLLGGRDLLGGIAIWGSIITLLVAWAHLSTRPEAPKRPATVILPKNLP